MPDITRVQDVIQPEVFTPYAINRTMELSTLIQSGIAENSTEFNDLASGPNLTANMPFWNDLEGDLEIMDDNGESEPGSIGSDKDVARKLGFVKSYGANALASMLSGDDPMRAIADLFAAYWNRQYQGVLLSTMDGIFAATNMTDKIYDITGKSGDAALINGKSFLDANQLMGDAKDLLTGIMIHSATETHLAKNDLLEYRQDSQGSVRVPYFMNKRVIVDDSIAFDTSTGASEGYLFGAGAIAWGNGHHKDIKETELVRNGLSLAGEDILVNRRLSILHPRGVKWVEPADGLSKKFPSLAELATGTNWNRVYDPKKIRIVKFMFKIN
ncbi:MAG: phage-related protein [Lachnospiraceae bacterium]|jgi:hypothetical protein|nr:phage-related protein [Lachnospiraceae bacterium]